jgi:hypothetical protein
MIFILSRLTKFAAIATVPAGLLAFSVPIAPALAWNEFDVCTTQIINSGVPANQAGVACSNALIPKELSECVATIRGRTAIAGIDALRGCYQVRRPIDLGNCVVDIVSSAPTATPTADKKSTPGAATPQNSATQNSATQNTDTNPQLAVLESCRASLLPGRYSQCVTALNRQVGGLTLSGALDSCLSAEAFPPELYPPVNANAQ